MTSVMLLRWLLLTAYVIAGVLSAGLLIVGSVFITQRARYRRRHRGSRQ